MAVNPRNVRGESCCAWFDFFLLSYTYGKSSEFGLLVAASFFL